MADDAMARIKAFLVNEPALKAKLDELEAENVRLEERLEKTVKNRDNILKEKRQLEGREPMRGHADELHLSREDARDPTKYRNMREQAEKMGKRLRIVDGPDVITANDGPPQKSPVAWFVDPATGNFHANRDFRDQPGMGPLRIKEMAEQMGAKQVFIYNSTRDLDDRARRLHDQAIVDRSNLLGDD